MKIWLIVGAVLLVIFGIYRMSRDHRNEGLLEIFFGALELVGEIIGAFL